MQPLLLESPFHRRSELRLDCSTAPQHNRGLDHAPLPHPNAPGPTDAAPDKAPLRPSTRPTAIRSSAHSGSTGLEDSPDCAHAPPSARTTPLCDRDTATTHASNPIIASPSLTPENHIPEQPQHYHLSTTVVLESFGLNGCFWDAILAIGIHSATN